MHSPTLLSAPGTPSPLFTSGFTLGALRGFWQMCCDVSMAIFFSGLKVCTRNVVDTNEGSLFTFLSTDFVNPLVLWNLLHNSYLRVFVFVFLVENKQSCLCRKLFTCQHSLNETSGICTGLLVQRSTESIVPRAWGTTGKYLWLLTACFYMQIPYIASLYL